MDHVAVVMCSLEDINDNLFKSEFFLKKKETQERQKFIFYHFRIIHLTILTSCQLHF